MVLENSADKPVKVKVCDVWSVAHDGKRYVNGDTLSVPEHIADEWERNRWVKRVVPKPTS